MRYIISCGSCEGPSRKAHNVISSSIIWENTFKECVTFRIMVYTQIWVCSHLVYLLHRPASSYKLVMCLHLFLGYMLFCMMSWCCSGGWSLAPWGADFRIHWLCWTHEDWWLGACISTQVSVPTQRVWPLILQLVFWQLVDTLMFSMSFWKLNPLWFLA